MFISGIYIWNLQSNLKLLNKGSFLQNTIFSFQCKNIFREQLNRFSLQLVMALLYGSYILHPRTMYMPMLTCHQVYFCLTDQCKQQNFFFVYARFGNLLIWTIGGARCKRCDEYRNFRLSVSVSVIGKKMGQFAGRRRTYQLIRKIEPWLMRCRSEIEIFVFQYLFAYFGHKNLLFTFFRSSCSLD